MSAFLAAMQRVAEARSLLQERRARFQSGCFGLFPAVSCVLHQGPVQRDDLSGVVFWDGRHRIALLASRRYPTDTADRFLRQS